MRKISSVLITNYRGIESKELVFPPAGAVAKGANGRGKTTILRAIRAALAGQDIGPDAIRQGADKAEILVNLDDLSVKRVITAKTSSLTVTKGTDGFKAPRPQTLLTELLGTSPLDPLDLFLAEPKKRRAKILEALPVTATLAGLRVFAPELPDDFDVRGHGLEVLERARKVFYDRRTEANRVAVEANRKASEARAAAEAAPAETGVNVPGTVLAVEQANDALVALHSRKQEAEASLARTASTRKRVEELRDEAKRIVESAPKHGGPEAIERARETVIAIEHEYTSAEAALVAAKHKLHDARVALATLREAALEVITASSRAENLEGQATELESAIAAATAPPTEDELAAAQAAHAAAKVTLDGARAVEGGRLVRAKAVDAVKASETSQAEADRLDTIVKALTEQAPAAILASVSGGIPGLTLDGEDVLLDGKRLDALCGAEQMSLAVEIARRANAKSKILVVDGLERLDPDQCEIFVREATRGDYQLIATRVDRGDVVLEAIEPDDRDSIAAE